MQGWPCSALRRGWGGVTHAANNHREQVTLADGSRKWVTRRDSTPKPPAARAAAPGPAPAGPPTAAAVDAVGAAAVVAPAAAALEQAGATAGSRPESDEQGSSESSSEGVRPVRALGRCRRARAREDSFFEQAVRERALALRPRLGPTASERLAAVRARVRERLCTAHAC